MRIKSNYKDRDTSKQLVINGEAIFNDKLQAVSVEEFKRLSKSMKAFLKTVPNNFDKVLLNNFYENNTRKKIEQKKQNELDTWESNRSLLEIKSFFTLSGNPLFINEKVDNITEEEYLSQQNEKRKKNCWKCGSSVSYSHPGVYSCTKCGFHSYVEIKNEELVVYDEAQYHNRGINKDQFFIDISKFEIDIKNYGLDMNLYYQEKERVLSICNPHPTDIEYCLFIYNALMLNILKQKQDYDLLGNLYQDIALFCYENGLYFYEFLYNSHLCTLLELKKMGCKRVRIDMMWECEKCSRLKGRILPIDVAINKMPIPNRKCINFNKYFDHEEQKELTKTGMILGLCRSEYSDAEYKIKL